MPRALAETGLVARGRGGRSVRRRLIAFLPNTRQRRPQAAAVSKEAARRDARVAAAAADAAKAFLAARRTRRQPAWAELPVVRAGDAAGCRAALAAHGVAVFRGALSATERESAEADFWAWAEKASPGLKRGDAATHDRLAALGYPDTGVVCRKGVQQSAFMWRCRLASGVQAAWRTVLGLEEDAPLAASLDGAGCWRNPHHAAHAGKKKIATRGHWYHIDQNHDRHPDRIGFQGLITLYPADACSGSLVVLPGSHAQYGRPRGSSFDASRRRRDL